MNSVPSTSSAVLDLQQRAVLLAKCGQKIQKLQTLNNSIHEADKPSDVAAIAWEKYGKICQKHMQNLIHLSQSTDASTTCRSEALLYMGQINGLMAHCQENSKRYSRGPQANVNAVVVPKYTSLSNRVTADLAHMAQAKPVTAMLQVFERTIETPLETPLSTQVQPELSQVKAQGVVTRRLSVVQPQASAVSA